MADQFVATSVRTVSSELYQGFFTFVEMIQQLQLDNNNVHHSSFDVTSLFTNVPLIDTIKICLSAFYEDSTTMTTPPIPQEVFVELIKYATSSFVEFSFDNIIKYATSSFVEFSFDNIM